MILENKTIPQTPGCYLFKDDKGQIIYVGKSKFLPKRVKSYFQKKHKDRKTRQLVESIDDVEFLITESDAEALIVEENLIKLYKPKFNIKGKDDKTIRVRLIIVNEDFPRVELVRNNELTGDILAEFTSSKQAREIHRLLHDVFPLRNCSYELTEKNITERKFKPCLEHQMGNCLAPCIGEMSKMIHKKMISDIRKIFEFKHANVRSSLIRKRNYHTKQLEFEVSNTVQHRINALDKLVKKLEPIRLIRTKEQLKEIGKFLELKKDPLIIESFDNSHTSQTNGVACSVRFVMGKPEKSSYRKYIIKQGKVGDDHSSFEEVLTRRFTRIKKENIEMPDLVIMDGGVAQLNTALKIFKQLDINIDVIGISKDERHKAKWIHLPMKKPIDIMKVPNHSILGKISDEVHRFTINFHRSRRDKI